MMKVFRLFQHLYVISAWVIYSSPITWVITFKPIGPANLHLMQAIPVNFLTNWELGLPFDILIPIWQVANQQVVLLIKQEVQLQVIFHCFTTVPKEAVMDLD